MGTKKESDQPFFFWLVEVKRGTLPNQKENRVPLGNWGCVFT